MYFISSSFLRYPSNLGITHEVQYAQEIQEVQELQESTRRNHPFQCLIFLCFVYIIIVTRKPAVRLHVLEEVPMLTKDDLLKLTCAKSREDIAAAVAEIPDEELRGALGSVIFLFQKRLEIEEALKKETLE